MNEKQKLFAQYIGQNILKINGGKGIRKCAPFWWEKDSNAFIQLTHPNNITDEHCVELFDLVIVDSKDLSIQEKIQCVKYWIRETDKYTLEIAETIISFLRSKGYAFQCNGRSIEEQVESGDVEIKD